MPSAKMTTGHVKMSAAVSRPYYKPSLGRIVFRHPGVLRKSEKVMKINEALVEAAAKGEAPATKCKGKDWPDFVRCLRKEMKRILAEAGLAKKAEKAE